VYYADNSLKLDTEPGFEIAKTVDFFIYRGKITISNKGNFESILDFKAAYRDGFLELQNQPEFAEIFSDLKIPVAYVGENKIQLRRANAIRSMGNYRDPNYMKNLRERHAQLGLKIAFDEMGRMIPTAETCRDIFQALLDHRLTSTLSAGVFDVPDAVKVTI
jgi:Domain of unknown function (DUF4868)